ncbi:MAG TPA: hypothetical protein VMT24_02450 [Aggregatilineaceae bacterium]|nr:hypothetical protein [Aggregatilineaceae bacterium]
MPKTSRVVAGTLALLTLVLAGCSQPGPDAAVKSFLTALLDGDENKMYETICPEWEAQAAAELDAFSGVTGALEGARCKQAGTDGDYTLITCTGRMVLSYQGEERDRSLEGRTYLTKRVDGEWKMCGYR